ncbi:hypothetical protein GDO78_016314 [Eleutherodactylus coqui]|uniref:Uncharacterized protein n=1 Tax=Eleutherodactylus coqui TaxID=57060 RepID=A0A8J6EL11_ELECQ|nr:hypothetical protein GDO78_016314 [Eleutherodactylus coqui]
MTARQRRGSRATAKVFSDAMSVMSHRTNRSASLPSIAGIGLGIQDVRPVAVSSVPVTRTTKSFPTIVRPGKSVVSRAVQVSSNEENFFLSKIKVLEKEILSLKSCLKEKEHLVTELDGTIKTQTLQFTRDLEHQINDHKSTRQSLEMSQRLVKEKEQLLDERIQHYEKVMRELQDQYEETLASLREQSQIEVNTRDERINKLKQQISELFKDKSWYNSQNVFHPVNYFGDWHLWRFTLYLVMVPGVQMYMVNSVSPMTSRLQHHKQLWCPFGSESNCQTAVSPRSL